MISDLSYYLFLRIICVYYYKFLCVKSPWPKRRPSTSESFVTLYSQKDSVRASRGAVCHALIHVSCSRAVYPSVWPLACCKCRADAEWSGSSRSMRLCYQESCLTGIKFVILCMSLTLTLLSETQPYCRRYC